jgi:hypothetical protein
VRSSGGHGSRRKERVHCAIYTRKSSEEGLEQEFNSLQAQREACEAFIASQRHEGWVRLATGYNDGGFSGPTTDRPALQRLLADVAAGRVDTIVVHKIDRLTRSLADFAKIVDAEGICARLGRLLDPYRYSLGLSACRDRMQPIRPISSSALDILLPRDACGYLRR